MQRIILLAIFLVSIQNSNQIDFTVTGLKAEGCKNPEYSFSIEGNCEDCSAITDRFNLNLETSKKQTVKAECYPMQILMIHKLLCTIDSSVYPLDNVNIILPTSAPKVDKYTFKNWETTIGANPGTSNVLKDAVCIPKVANTFTPSSITDDDCDALGYSTFTINGEWEDKSSLNIPTIDSTVKIFLDNSGQDAADCDYMNDPVRFACKIRGDGRLKVKEQNVTIGSFGPKAYKIKGYDSGKSISDCDDDWLFDNATSLSLNKVMIVICLLLF